jgi:hypothetical protein
MATHPAQITVVRALPFAVLLALGFSSSAFAQSEKIPAAVPLGHYHCHPGAKSIDFVAGFVIRRDGIYRHDDGSVGKFVYDATQALITFEGGSLDKQQGHVALSRKLGIVRIYNDDRSGTARTCDTGRQ